MITSFLATTLNHKGILRDIQSNNKKTKSLLLEDGKWCFLFKGSEEIESCSYKSKLDTSFYFVGNLLNVNEVKQLALIYDSDALSGNVANLAYILYNNLGLKGLSILEGAYTILIRDFEGKLKVITDPLGLMPTSILKSSAFWISSEIKDFCNISEEIEFKTCSELLAQEPYQDNYSPIKNIYKIKPGEVVIIAQDGMKYHHIESKINHFFRLNQDQSISKSEAISLIDAILTSSVKNCLQGEGEVSIPLSGGLDSSLVSSIASRQCKNVNTISIGTDRGNEFRYAEIVARHINSNHKELVLTEEDIMKGVADAIYHNEIFDGLSAEIQSSLFLIYKKGGIRSDSTMITGYGADLLFGGIVPSNYNKKNINPFLWHQIYRTRWTGEFSNFGAAHYGIKVKHPFWVNRLVAFCLNLSPGLKIANNEIKFILKEYASSFNLLPDETIKRKKTGIHEGSSVNAIFADIIGVDMNDYKSKTRFTYQVYQEFFKNKKKPDNIDIQYLVANFKNKKC